MPAASGTRKITLSRKTAPCPLCGTEAKRHSLGHRRLREASAVRPTILEVTYSKHYCIECRKHFSAPTDHLAPPSGRFTNRVRTIAVDYARTHTFERTTTYLQQRYHVAVPSSTIHDWVVAAIKEGNHGYNQRAGSSTAVAQ